MKIEVALDVVDGVVTLDGHEVHREPMTIEDEAVVEAGKELWTRIWQYLECPRRSVFRWNSSPILRYDDVARWFEKHWLLPRDAALAYARGIHGPFKVMHSFNALHLVRADEMSAPSGWEPIDPATPEQPKPAFGPEAGAEVEWPNAAEIRAAHSAEWSQRHADRAAWKDAWIAQVGTDTSAWRKLDEALMPYLSSKDAVEHFKVDMAGMSPSNYDIIKGQDTAFTRLLGCGDLGWMASGTVAQGKLKQLVIAEYDSINQDQQEES